MKVIVIGAGLGGLALAQGLQNAGIEVDVYERDRSSTGRLQGYRIHIAPFGCRALNNCLSPDLYALFVETTGAPNRCLSFFSEELDPLLTLDTEEVGVDVTDPVESYKSVSRITFRSVLLKGLEEHTHFDKAFERYETTADGVTAYFTDGTTATADLLVGADGTSSRVQRQYLPDAGRVDLGAIAIAGKIPLDSATENLLPWQFGAGGTMIFAPGGLSGFAAAHRFGTTIDTENSSAGILFDNTRDYIMWNVIATWERFGGQESLESATPAALKDIVADRIQGWHPNLRELVARTSPDTVALLPLRSSVKPQPWQPSNVTVLGDAIHAMPPTAGAGANTALVDADTLREQLIRVDNGEIDLLSGVGNYEAHMRDFAFKYVGQADRNLRNAVKDNRVALAGMRSGMKLIGRIGPVRRKMERALVK
ncbi:FAD-dependent oxidoreductase [Antrihabitans stalactiti]|uniref:FAD-dependent monooxygenase n=1 Tax=Antrihabitans stalactiti TaxID=2584121 RepID=A0A848KA21_9NOCA|nr:NAD(P)/FAD-dependent oxidoreductase [Antrihabitans stalactiti]NMN94496.1 FAD-dependent monooxygenase [Antrihabitans stalactiti]